MYIDCQTTDSSILYKVLSGVIIPRPIAWVATYNAQGIHNLAPFSFFNAVGDDPPHIVFSTVRTGNKNKDTLNNILENQEFVVNMVSEALVEKMNATSGPYPPETDEFEVHQIEYLPANQVKARRVAQSQVQLECRMVHHYFLEDHKNGGAALIVGRVLAMHLADDIINEQFRINTAIYKPVARLAGSQYAKLGEIFTLQRNTSV